MRPYPLAAAFLATAGRGNLVRSSPVCKSASPAGRLPRVRTRLVPAEPCFRDLNLGIVRLQGLARSKAAVRSVTFGPWTRRSNLVPESVPAANWPEP